jgi:hypothetical protein
MSINGLLQFLSSVVKSSSFLVNEECLLIFLVMQFGVEVIKLLPASEFITTVLSVILCKIVDFATDNFRSLRFQRLHNGYIILLLTVV